MLVYNRPIGKAVNLYSLEQYLFHSSGNNVHLVGAQKHYANSQVALSAVSDNAWRSAF
jgi:hypothetical protein